MQKSPFLSDRAFLWRAREDANLRYQKDKAKKGAFLLEIGVTAKLDTQEANPTYRACVGCVQLPVAGASELTATERGTAWLQEKAKPAGGAAQ